MGIIFVPVDKKSMDRLIACCCFHCSKCMESYALGIGPAWKQYLLFLPFPVHFRSCSMHSDRIPVVHFQGNRQIFNHGQVVNDFLTGTKTPLEIYLYQPAHFPTWVICRIDESVLCFSYPPYLNPLPMDESRRRGFREASSSGANTWASAYAEAHHSH